MYDLTCLSESIQTFEITIQPAWPPFKVLFMYSQHNSLIYNYVLPKRLIDCTPISQTYKGDVKKAHRLYQLIHIDKSAIKYNTF